ncbi:MAG: phosphoribosylformylglycinamidine synthase I [Endomicrobiia bacterium]
MKSIKTIVLRAAGTNNDIETAFAFKQAGAEVDIVHINKLIRKEINLLNYHILAIPGGFSYGDDISAGKIFANELKYKLHKEILRFIELKRPVIGICNGFQILVKAGFLPETNTAQQKVSLVWNNSAKFECRWVYLKVKNKKNLWLTDFPDIIRLPVAHAEGKFVVDSDETLNELERNGQIAFQYCDEKGNTNCDYPFNPNGSIKNIAGIINIEGNILGMMPHPERYISFYQGPNWTRRKSDSKFGDGFLLFKNAVEYCRKNL